MIKAIRGNQPTSARVHPLRGDTFLSSEAPVHQVWTEGGKKDALSPSCAIKAMTNRPWADTAIEEEKHAKNARRPRS